MTNSGYSRAIDPLHVTSSLSFVAVYGKLTPTLGGQRGFCLWQNVQRSCLQLVCRQTKAPLTCALQYVK